MRIPGPMAGALTLLLAMPVTAQTHRTYGPINCVYDRLSATQRAQVDVGNIDSGSNLRLLEPAFEACATRHKWPGELLLVVVEHLNARLTFERAEAQIVRAGGKAGAVANAWHAMTEDERIAARDSDAQAAESLRRRAPDLIRFGTHGIKAVSAYAEMKAMESAWTRIDPNG